MQYRRTQAITLFTINIKIVVSSTIQFGILSYILFCYLSQNLVVLLSKNREKGEKDMAIKTVQATINGQTYTLTLNSTSGKYEATVTAPSKSSYNQSGHYYGVTVKATDVAGNITTKDAADATLGKSLRLQVKEKAAPIIAITAPTVGTYLTNNKPTITWKVTDADSGVNPATIGITIDSETNRRFNCQNGNHRRISVYIYTDNSII